MRNDPTSFMILMKTWSKSIYAVQFWWTVFNGDFVKILCLFKSWLLMQSLNSTSPFLLPLFKNVFAIFNVWHIDMLPALLTLCACLQCWDIIMRKLIHPFIFTMKHYYYILIFIFKARYCLNYFGSFRQIPFVEYFFIVLFWMLYFLAFYRVKARNILDKMLLKNGKSKEVTLNV